MKKEKVLVIVGPTAVGKTALSIDLAEKFHGEIISGDSLQVYKQLDIGTAKVTDQEKKGIPHYLINEKEMTDSFSVSEFQTKGRQYISEISNRGKLPIVVGGTGLYIQALLFDFKLGGDRENEQNDKRAEIENFYEEYGQNQLWHRLVTQDTQAEATIHPNNIKRVIRAIEVVETTGKSITQQSQERGTSLSNALYDVKLIGLSTDRELLYKRINQRVDMMLEQGVLDEAKRVYQKKECQAAQGIGYKEFFPYFDGQQSLEECVEKVKQNSRRYAKRQLTWFRNRMETKWWDLVQFPNKQTELEKDVADWLK